MGFDNLCLPNMQSLPGEYFCPVCRLLVYPNEALQSLCTHLYCKQCLTYVSSTTRACPYDGYLATEADSKPLTESNKALAETIGKITVKCLYNKSGCTWQGALNDSTSHCSGCAFGNSFVVCNRCGLQIVHRQVHEHMYSCPGVHSQVQPAVAQTTSTAGTIATGDQNQANAQAVAISSLPQSSQTAAITTPGQDPNQKANTTAQAQTSMPAVTLAAESWYQQQCQQYYQQYPGYGPYQQHYQQYHPHQQQAVVQYPQSQHLVPVQPQVRQPQPQAWPQVQPQLHPRAQQPVAAQPQNPLQQHMQHPVQPHSLVQSQGQVQLGAPPAQPQLDPLTQPQMPAPQYQLAHLHVQHPQSHIQLQAQTQPNLQAQAPANAHLQTFAPQPMYPNLPLPAQYPSAQSVVGHQSYPQPQFQPQQQVLAGAVQHSVQMLPHSGPQPQHLVQMQSHLPQQHSLLRSDASTQSVPQPNLIPSQALPQPHQPMHAQAPGISGNQHHLMPTGQQFIDAQYVQQQQQQPVLSGSSLGPVQSQAHEQGPYSQLQPQGPPQLLQQPSEDFPLQHHGMQTHQAQGISVRPMMSSHGMGMQLYPQSAVDVQKSAQAGVHTSEICGQDKLSSLKDVKQAPDEVDVAEVKTIRPESELGSMNSQIKFEGDSKDMMESNGEPILKQVKQEPAKTGISVPDYSVKMDIKTKQLQDQNMKLRSGGLMLPSYSVPVVGQGKQQPFASQHRPAEHLAQFPGHPLTQERPLGPGVVPHLGPALHPQSEHLQQPLHNKSHGSEYFFGGKPSPGSARPFGGFPGETESFPRFNAPMFGLTGDEFRPKADERIKSFPSDPACHIVDQGGMEDLKRFSRPSHFNTDKAPPSFSVDIAPSPRPLEKGPRAGSLGAVPPSRLFPPCDVGEGDAIQTQRDYPGSYRRQLDGMPPRSPGRDYLGTSSRGFPVHGLDDVNGRDSLRFNDSMGNAFHDSRFPTPHLLRREFDGPGRDGLPSNLPRGEHFGPRNLESNLQLGEAPGFAGLPGYSRMGDFSGPGNFRGPRPDEPGYRSSFSHKGFPGDAGRFTGNLESFENSRKRRPPSIGWCRICEVDCETVEGLDLHSQTREHQKRAMDMVMTIKQNAKKQKVDSSDHFSAEDGSKSKGACVEGSGKED